MRAGRNEAMALFSTWAEDSTLLRCEIRLQSLAAAFRGRLREVSDRLVLLSDDKNTELVLPLRDDFIFGYGDMRDFPQEAKEFNDLVVIFFPYVGAPDQADQIVLAEVRE